MNPIPKIKKIALNSEFLWISAGQLMNVVGILLFLKIAASSVNPEEYGEFTIAFTVATIVNQIYTGGVIAAIFRYYSIAQSANKLKNFTVSLVKISKNTIKKTAIWILPISIGMHYWGETKLIPLVLAMFLYALIQFIIGLMTSIYNAARERKIPSKTQIIEPIARIVIFTLIAKYSEVSSLSIGVTYVLSSTIAACYQLCKIKKYLSFQKIDSKENNLEKEINNFSRPFIIWGIFSSIHQISDRYALSYYAGDSSVGEYGFMYQLGYGPVVLATNVIVNYISPMIYKNMGHSLKENEDKIVKKQAQKASGLIIAITGAATIFTYVFTKEILLLLGSAEYISNSHLLPILILSAGVFSASQVLAVNILGSLEPKKIRDVKIYTGVLGVAMNIIGAKCFGIDGVVYSGLLYSIMHFLGILLKSK